MTHVLGSIAQDLDAPSEAVSDRPNFGSTTRVATYVALFLFVAMLAFSAFAPIAGGAIAIGTVNPDGSRRVVQHFEGGIISEILVRDGDLVESGQPLLILDNTSQWRDGRFTIGKRIERVYGLIRRNAGW